MKFSLAIILLTLHLGAIAQSSVKEKKAARLYEQYSYYPAIERYEKMDTLSEDALRKLAESYRHTQQPEKSAASYAALVNKNANNSEDLFQYASVLRASGKYEESGLWMEKFKERVNMDKRAQSFERESPNLPNLLHDQGQYIISLLDINTDDQDFGPSFYLDQVVFSSNREVLSGFAPRYNWTNKPFLDMYSATKSGVQLGSPVIFQQNLNNKYHEGPASFSADGKLMAFTRNNYEDKSSDGTINLKIFFSTKDESGFWSEPISFDLNNSEYSVGHPALSADGRSLYFASDMPGGFGGVDLYWIEQNEKGAWTNPVNLGPAINTEADEMFPFYQEDQQVLFFSSNGHFGLGGLDIFTAKDFGNHVFSGVLNTGAPLNTRFDDFGLIIDRTMANGYFTSNREGGKGDDDLYALQINKPFRFGKIISGVVKDQSGLALSDVIVSLKDASGRELQTMTTGLDGHYQFVVDPDQDFVLQGTKSDYFDANKKASARTPKDEIIADLALEKDPGFSLYGVVTNKKTGEPLSGVQITVTDVLLGQSVTVVTPESGDFRKALHAIKLNDTAEYLFTLVKDGFFTKTLNYTETFNRMGQYDLQIELDYATNSIVEDPSKLVSINPINFDLDKYNIRPDAGVELDKIIAIMNEYPDMVLELGAHTDCRGGVKYNQVLSEKRVKSAAAYIQARISNPERISGKGYGESRLLNGCDCEGTVKSTCSEAEHQLNRRVEFRVISIGHKQIEVINNSTNSFDDKIIADKVLEKDPGFSLYGVVTDKKTGQPLSGVQITVTDVLLGQSVTVVTPESGDFRKALHAVKLNDTAEYLITLVKDGFFTKTVNYTATFNRMGQYDLQIELDYATNSIVEDPSKLVSINPINFDLDKYNIRPDAAVELDKIIAIMNEYPDMVLELGAHTDCRSSVAYNQALSEKRVKSAAAYIQARISNPERISGKGYGESRLLNGCACEGTVQSTCSEAEHQLNRRVEFKVISTGNKQLEVINNSTNSFD